MEADSPIISCVDVFTLYCICLLVQDVSSMFLLFFSQRWKTVHFKSVYLYNVIFVSFNNIWKH